LVPDGRSGAQGRYHFWRVVEKDSAIAVTNAPCVFLSWEWVFQGVSQRGISTECWVRILLACWRRSMRERNANALLKFAMKNASLCANGWAFDPRRAIVEAAKVRVVMQTHVYMMART
jgi:hypothetical protein